MNEIMKRAQNEYLDKLHSNYCTHCKTEGTLIVTPTSIICKKCGYEMFNLANVKEQLGAYELGKKFIKEGLFHDAWKMFDEAKEHADSTNMDIRMKIDILYNLILCEYGVQIIREQEPISINNVICHYAINDTMYNSKYYEELKRMSKVDKTYTEEKIDNLVDIERKRIQIIEGAKSKLAKYDIFICTKIGAVNGVEPLEKKAAEKVYDALKDNGYDNVFLSSKTLGDMGAAGPYYRYLFDALDNCKVILFFYSNLENATAFDVNLEWQRGINDNKVIVPIYVSDKEDEKNAVNILKLLKLDLQGIFTTDEDERIRRVLNIAHNIIGKPNKPTDEEIKHCVNKLYKINSLYYVLLLMSSLVFFFTLSLASNDYILGFDFIDNMNNRYVILVITGILTVFSLIKCLFFISKQYLEKIAIIKLNKKAFNKFILRIKRYMNNSQMPKDLISENYKIINTIKALYKNKLIYNEDNIGRLDEIYDLFIEIDNSITEFTEDGGTTIKASVLQSLLREIEARFKKI